MGSVWFAWPCDEAAMIINIKVNGCEVMLYQGLEFIHASFIWTVVDFERDGVLCEVNLSSEACLFDYNDVAEWALETQESIEYWDAVGMS